MISVQGVTKRYGKRSVLRGVSLDARPGEITLLLGANGAGKSTLLRCVLGIVDFAGAVSVCGQNPLTDGPAVRAHVGYMPQNGGLHPDLSVAETMEFYAAIRRSDVARIAPLLREAGLADETQTRVADLSGGMRQRLGFAVALLSDPDVLILDEPTASLDAAGRRWIADRLQQLAAEGRTILVSTHVGHQLIGAGARCLTLEDGRLIESETATVQVGAPAPPLAPSAAARVGDARPLIRKELRDGLRNRWLIAFAALLGVLGLAATASGYDSVAGLGLQMFGRTTATLMNLSLLLAPLVGVLIGAASIAGERERGTLEHLLAQPLSRTKLLLAKHAGLLIAISLAIVAGFAPAALLVAAVSGGAMLLHFLLFPLLAVGAAAALAGIGLLISVSSRSAVQAQGAAVAVWFALALLYDLVLIGSLAAGGLSPQWLVPALVANPIDATRVLGVLALDPDLYMLGPAGVLLTTTLGSAGAAVALAAAIALWNSLPVAAAAFWFSAPLRRGASHEVDECCPVPGGSRSRRHHRVRYRRAGI